MEVQEPLKAYYNVKQPHLSPFRLVRGLVCLLVYLSSAFTFLVYFGPPVAGFMRLVSIRYCRRMTASLFGLWLALWPFLFEKINGTKVVFSGDSVPAGERVLIIANHKTEVDWMYLWNLALRKGCLGSIKYVLKSSLMKLPIFGWGFHILEFISVERKWEADERVMHEMLSTFKDPQDPLWLALFPEGTDFTEEKCQKSQKYASEVGLPVLTNVLLPKTKGFCLCLEVLRGCLDAVYDVTIAYKYQCPSFLDNVFGLGPAEVHIHVRRVPAKDIPDSEDKATTWLLDSFQLKDQLLTDFNARGHFPNRGTEEELSTLKVGTEEELSTLKVGTEEELSTLKVGTEEELSTLKGGTEEELSTLKVGTEEELSTLKGLVNIALVITLTAICAYLTLYSSIWYKIYVSFACAYLTVATLFKLRPMPVIPLLKRLFVARKSRSE